MDIANVVAALKEQRTRIDHAIAALGGFGSPARRGVDRRGVLLQRFRCRRVEGLVSLAKAVEAFRHAVLGEHVVSARHLLPIASR